MFPEDAFIYPHEPMVRDQFREAFIFPEDPFPKREDETGIVVAMDGTARNNGTSLGRELLHPNGVADVLEALSTDLTQHGVADVLDALSTDLKQHGIVGLIIEPGASPFEKDLKIHLAEYFSKHS